MQMNKEGNAFEQIECFRGEWPFCGQPCGLAGDEWELTGV
jgi:hypothetical protein